MGSSTRKIQQKIKKIISDSKGELDDTLPKVINETIRMKKAKKYFGDKDFGNLVTGGMSGISALSSGKFGKDYGIEYDINLEESIIKDKIKTEQIIEAILDKVEENQEIENGLILAAFKATMAEIILNNLLNSEAFLKKFMCNLLYSLIMENINEALIEIYDDIHTKDFRDRVKKFANDTIEEYMSKPIKDYIEKKIDLAVIIEKVSKLNENIKDNNFE
ncbi:hypothetical protein [Candidatus Clostridium helianthi]|uniref:Uncharacterized protein n=1 Tax=Candidatus Clostridium helianthi TaxID=3381660 RepID=A0ABW8S3E3_9CLOT